MIAKFAGNQFSFFEDPNKKNKREEKEKIRQFMFQNSLENDAKSKDETLSDDDILFGCPSIIDLSIKSWYE